MVSGQGADHQFNNQNKWMLMSKIKIVSVDKKQGLQIFGILQAAGMHGSDSFDAWLAIREWLRLRQRLEEENLGLAVETDNELIGFIGIFRSRMKIGSEICNVFLMGDNAVHPRHQGLPGLSLIQHIVRAYARETIGAMHFARRVGEVWQRLGGKAIEGSDSTYEAVISWRFTLIEKFPILRPFSAVLKIADCEFFQPFLYALSGRRAPKRNFYKSVVIQQWNQSNDVSESPIADLCDRFSKAYNIGVFRDPEYLRWRYMEHPSGGYHLWNVFENRKQIGLLVLKLKNRKQLFLYEMIFDPTVDGAVPKMIGAVVEAANRLGASMLFSKSVLPVVASGFVENGFSVSYKGYRQCIIVSPKTIEGPLLFTYGDYKND
jgi:hypothetical protein